MRTRGVEPPRGYPPLPPQGSASTIPPRAQMTHNHYHNSVYTSCQHVKVFLKSGEDPSSFKEYILSYLLLRNVHSIKESGTIGNE